MQTAEEIRLAQACTTASAEPALIQEELRLITLMSLLAVATGEADGKQLTSKHISAHRLQGTLLPEQHLLVTKIFSATSADTGVCNSLDAPGGTGKTYTLNKILTELRSKSQIALAVASCGIAALLLSNERTFIHVSCHTTRKLG
eukprot:2746587-Pleurochrysis_carterae.AAC.1